MSNFIIKQQLLHQKCDVILQVYQEKNVLLKKAQEEYDLTECPYEKKNWDNEVDKLFNELNACMEMYYHTMRDLTGPIIFKEQSLPNAIPFTNMQIAEML